MRANCRQNTITHYLSMRYKSCLSLAYFLPDARLFANTPSMKRHVVKKNHIHGHALFSYCQREQSVNLKGDTPFGISPLTCFYIEESYFSVTNRMVSRAMTISSSVGITQTVTFESGAEMMASLPRTLLASASIFTPKNSNPLQASRRVPI